MPPSDPLGEPRQMMKAPYRPATSYDVAIGSSAASSAQAISANIMAVRLVATSACYVKFGTSPTADTTTSFMLAPNFPETFLVRAGESVSVIQVSASGTLNITELTY